MIEIEKYARAAASTARTPPNSPARRAALEAENAARVAAEQFVKGLEAERKGAEAMREAAQATPSGIDERGIPTVTVWQIRALPLPTGPRQAVPLTDEQIDSLRLQTGYAAGMERFSIIAHDIEGAVLAANNLEVRRG